jgi:hypothetical protein
MRKTVPGTDNLTYSIIYYNIIQMLLIVLLKVSYDFGLWLTPLSTIFHIYRGSHHRGRRGRDHMVVAYRH